MSNNQETAKERREREKAEAEADKAQREYEDWSKRHGKGGGGR